MVALAGPFASPAPAQQLAPGTFSISPSRRDLVGRPPATLLPTNVSNTTRDTYAVHVFPVLLSQNLSGAFQFREDPAGLNDARNVLSAMPSDFTLAPGQTRQVALRWQLVPLNSRAAYLGVVFQGQPKVKGGSVQVVSRLLSVNFLRLPGTYHPSGVFTALHAVQFAPQKLRLLLRVKNTGDIVATPERGRVAIREAGGRVVFKGPWTGDVVLPGAQREFPVDVIPLLPGGSYVATAVMTFGANHNVKISVPFQLVGPNSLPTPAVRVDAFAAHGDIGGSAHVSGRVLSTGSAATNLDLGMSLYRVTNGQAAAAPLSTRTVSFPGLAPQSERALSADLPGRLSAGEYRVVAHYTDPTGAPQEITSDFASTARQGFLDRLKLFFDRHTTVLLVGLIGLVLLVLVMVLLRRQRRLQAELRSARQSRGSDDAG